MDNEKQVYHQNYMGRPKSNKAKDFTDKERFFQLLNRAATQKPKGGKTGAGASSEGYSGKRARPHTSVNG